MPPVPARSSIAPAGVPGPALRGRGFGVVATAAAILWSTACGDSATLPPPAPNRAPVPSGSIPAQTLSAGQTATVDASGYFSDPDGDPLTYTAASSNAAVAAASVSGSVITVGGLEAGMATITVGATDPAGHTAQHSFGATVLGIPAAIAVAAGDGQSAPVATAVPVAPEALVTDADGVPLAGIPVVFTTESDATVARSEVRTDARGRAGPGAWTLGTAAGVQWLFASLEGAGIQGNPLRFEAVALAGPAARLVAVEGDGQEAETTLPVRTPPRARVEDAHGNPVAAGVAVRFSASGSSRVIPTATTTDSAGFAGVEQWTLGTSPGATYRLTASLAGDEGAEPLVFTATATPPVYDIEIVHVNPSILTESQLRAFEAAERYWERAITGNLDSNVVSKDHLDLCLDLNDINHDVPGDRLVDDLLIYVEIKDIDGPAGVFGGAGPCQIRKANSLPAVGVMFFDLGDMAGMESKGHLEDTILHEMAHVIGFGTIWSRLGLLHDPAGHGRSANTHFTGEAAIAAFHEIRGGHYPESDSVPVQNLGGEGVWNGHWRELVFRSELMTPSPNRGLNPLSAVTLASLEDVGYEGIDYGVADEYVLPPPAYADAAPEYAMDPGYTIDLSEDMLRSPVAVVDRDGNVVRMIPPPAGG